jgi:hypothetical protein
MRHQRQRHRADLVRGIAVGRDAIRTHHDGMHQPALHRRGRHRIGDQTIVHAGLLQLPRGESRALQERARLVDIHRERRALVGLEYHAHGRAAARRCERAGVAVGQHTGSAAQQHSAMTRHRGAAAGVVALEFARLLQQRGERALGGRRVGQGLERRAALLECPEQIHRRGPRTTQVRRHRRGRAAHCGERRGLASRRAQVQSIGGCHADGRSATHRQPADRVEHVLLGADGQKSHAAGQPCLVEQLDRLAGPFKCRDGSHRRVIGSRGIIVVLGVVAMGMAMAPAQEPTSPTMASTPPLESAPDVSTPPQPSALPDWMESAGFLPADPVVFRVNPLAPDAPLPPLASGSHILMPGLLVELIGGMARQAPSPLLGAWNPWEHRVSTAVWVRTPRETINAIAAAIPAIGPLPWLDHRSGRTGLSIAEWHPLPRFSVTQPWAPTGPIYFIADEDTELALMTTDAGVAAAMIARFGLETRIDLPPLSIRMPRPPSLRLLVDDADDAPVRLGWSLRDRNGELTGIPPEGARVALLARWLDVRHVEGSIARAGEDIRARAFLRTGSPLPATLPQRATHRLLPLISEPAVAIVVDNPDDLYQLWLAILEREFPDWSPQGIAAAERELDEFLGVSFRGRLIGRLGNEFALVFPRADEDAEAVPEPVAVLAARGEDVADVMGWMMRLMGAETDLNPVVDSPGTRVTASVPGMGDLHLTWMVIPWPEGNLLVVGPEGETVGAVADSIAQAIHADPARVPPPMEGPAIMGVWRPVFLLDGDSRVILGVEADESAQGLRLWLDVPGGTLFDVLRRLDPQQTVRPPTR